jgi:hypothetical protein
MKGAFFAITVAVVLAAPISAAAQASDGERWYVTLDGAYRVDAQKFQDDATFQVSAEEGRFDSRYTVKSGPMIDASGSILINRTFAIGMGVSHYSRSTPVRLVASVPHPLYFGRPRSVSGDVAGLTRKELGVHVQARGMFPIGSRFTVTLFGGPSYFDVSQDVVTDVVYADSYPYDEAIFQSAGTASGSKAALGFNGGGDIAVFFTPRAGIGFSVQFAGANLELPAAGGGSTRIKAGGVSTGAGLRLRY